jgi:tRNA (guanine-N7-)-methyltransferase
MGSKKKLQKFAENLTFPNLFQPDYEEIKDGFELKGKWGIDFFGNTNPIVLELGCGKGEYTVGLAAKYPGKNFIGVDVKGARLWRGCKTSNEENMKNVAFIRAKIQHIDHFFGPGEIDEVWITFPDPQPKNSKRNKRLTSQVFLNRYARIVKPDAVFHLKTDNEPLFDYTLEVIEENGHRLITAVKDLYHQEGFEEVKSIKTHYEKLFSEQGYDINYLKFRLNNSVFDNG